MNDIVVGAIFVVIGAAFCFRGYLAMRIIIPIWGAFAGLVLGAGLVEAVTGDGFLATLLGWLVGLAFALMFALIAYLYYQVAVVIGMSSIGFVLGTGLMVALGVSWSWVIVLVGVAVAVLLAALALVFDLPMVILTVLTALAGATTIVAGAMLIVGVLDLDDLERAGTTSAIDDDWGWYLLYLVLAVAGMISQVRATDRQRDSLRQAWSGAQPDAVAGG